MKQYEAVIKVMEENGGYATLKHLYENVFKVKNVNWKTKTPFASIRRIVQNNKYFFKIKPGLWALKSFQNKLPNEINSLFQEDDNNIIDNKFAFTHSYYQGLLIEIGNLKNYNTYIPMQDRTKLFLGKPLKSLTILSEIPKFTYDNIINKAKYIDVIWFNERKFPAYAFEIEHSTDFKNSFLKFLELQDFYLKMFVVSAKAKENKFQAIINSYSSFKAIKERVQFLSYEDLAEWHFRTFKHWAIEQKILSNHQNND